MSVNKGNIVFGEAPESDSEDELNVSDGVPVSNNNSAAQGKVVAGEAPESDDETLGKSGSLDSISSAVSASSSTLVSGRTKKSEKRSGSLLTKKLHERNVSLAKNMSDFATHTISNANNELNTVDQQLLKCQLNLQEASDLLQSLNHNVSQLDAKMQSLLSASYIPEIKIDKT